MGRRDFARLEKLETRHASQEPSRNRRFVHDPELVHRDRCRHGRLLASVRAGPVRLTSGALELSTQEDSMLVRAIICLAGASLTLAAAGATIIVSEVPAVEGSQIA
jgi:hypothetical protein